MNNTIGDTNMKIIELAIDDDVLKPVHVVRIDERHIRGKLSFYNTVVKYTISLLYSPEGFHEPL